MTLLPIDIVVLTCHPDTLEPAVGGIAARVAWTRRRSLAITYRLKGDLARLRIPPPASARRAERLWQHTCFEAFISAKGRPEYYEFNFAPSSEWAAYAFRRYRDSAPVAAEEPAPAIAVRGARNLLELDVLVDIDSLAEMNSRAPLRIALCVVIENSQGMLSYWALKHPPGKPDFHHPDCFALALAAPDAEAMRERLE
jgi:hypothetical protein